MKINLNLFKISPLILFMMSGSLLCGCNDNSSSGFNNKSYDISLNQDNSLIAKTTKISDGYRLEIDGTGSSLNYTRKKVPWYSIAPFITEININEGITDIGENLFSDLNFSYFILPSSVSSVKNNSFKDNIVLYSYSNTFEGNEFYTTYYYSELTPPNDGKTYWHFVNDNPTIWVVSQIKVLFIGNSFTYYNDLPLLTQEVAKSLGYDFISDSITQGSYTLTKFADNTDPKGKEVEDKLNSTNDYDYVILQEQSTRSYENPNEFEKAVSDLNIKIKNTQENASIRLYETWGFPIAANELKITIPEVEEKIRNEYDRVGNKYNLDVHYVGEAFSYVYQNYQDINLYNDDGRHPSYEGSYLASLVHVASLLGVDIRATTFIGDLNEDVANTLQEVAYKIVFNK